jgi:hypothetical protein
MPQRNPPPHDHDLTQCQTIVARHAASRSLEDDVDVHDGKMDADSIEAITMRRKLDIKLRVAKIKVMEVEDILRKGRSVKSECTCASTIVRPKCGVCKSSSSDVSWRVCTGWPHWLNGLLTCFIAV